MNESQQNRVRIGLIVAALVAVLVNLFIFARPRPLTINLPKPRPTLIPESGVAITKHFDAVPGNPEFTEEQMKQVYQYIQIFKRRNGCVPAPIKGRSLPKDMNKNFREYGFNTMMDAFKAFANPDVWSSDELAGKPVNPNFLQNPYIFPLRPDGSDKCTDKLGSGRDVLAFTGIYAHVNQKNFRGDYTSFKPIGFYVVLWDDGTVERVPVEKARYVKFRIGRIGENAPNPYGTEAMFPGQYGIEKVETESFAEHYHLSPSGK